MDFSQIYEPTEEDCLSLIEYLLQHNEALVNGCIDVAGGIDEAIKIIANAPHNVNAYDVMFQKYKYLESFFMIDHNLTINLDDLKQAIEDYQRMNK